MRRLKRNSNVNYKLIILIIIVVFFFVISIGYSYLQTQLKINGKATIKPQEQVVSYPKGNSRCTYKIEKNSIQNNTGNCSYDITLNIVNNDEDAEAWNLEFDITNSAKNILCSYQHSINKGRMKITYKSDNQVIQKGSTRTINFKVDLQENDNLTIKNMTLNGLLVEVNLL